MNSDLGYLAISRDYKSKVDVMMIDANAWERGTGVSDVLEF